ncbi:MAG: hypothetical protein HUK40_09885 [Desulfobacter sp.]|nr:hypothetical protein [Desulfobacter sp.]WDP84371.1 MAG: hypothetical protein HUN05_03745 [Desulfobacter sp.]
MTETLYYTALILVSLELAALLGKMTRIHILALVLRTLAAWAGVVFVIVRAGRPPLYGPFEASIFIAALGGTLALIFGKKPQKPGLFYLASALTALGVLALQWGKPMEFNPDYYMYANLWVILFFNFRLLGVSVLLHGTTQYLTFAMAGSKVYQAGGRNTLLAGACVYLAGEWTGSLWCLNWLGDSWQWSHGFFKASILFLLVMAACHQPKPKDGPRHPAIQGITGALPGLFGIYMIFFH